MENMVNSLKTGYEDDVKIADFAFKIATAIKKLHDHNIYHFDLKPGNIMLMNDYTPVIGDLGLTQTLSIATKMSFVGGTPLFLGEQVAERGGQFKLGPQPDLYAIGVILYLMITKEKPTWYIKYSGYQNWKSRTLKVNYLLDLFDSTL